MSGLDDGLILGEDEGDDFGWCGGLFFAIFGFGLVVEVGGVGVFGDDVVEDDVECGDEGIGYFGEV